MIQDREPKAPAALRRAIMERYAKRPSARDRALANAEAWERLKAMALAPSIFDAERGR